MEKYIRKYFWTINLLTIAICATLAAKSFNTFLGAYLLGDSPIEVKVSPAPETGEPVVKEIPKRRADTNPFTGEKIAPPVAIDIAGEGPFEPLPEDPAEYTSDTACQITTLPGSLVATVAATNPENAFALISSSDKISMFEVGHEIQPNAKLVAVVRHKIFIDNNGRIECMFHGEQNEKKPPTKTELKQTLNDAAEEGVRKVSETEFIISEATLAGSLENLNVLATQARIVPSFKNGVANGFRIYSIKPGSLYQKIGIKNGDILQRINGMELNSPEKALELYTKLRSEKRLSMDLLRRGSKTTLDYTIQ